jgi:hypothetical protein
MVEGRELEGPVLGEELKRASGGPKLTLRQATWKVLAAWGRPHKIALKNSSFGRQLIGVLTLVVMSSAGMDQLSR